MQKYIYIYLRLSLLEKEAQLRIEVAGKPEHNPRNSGRKPFKEYRCKECNMLFATAVLRSEHKRARATRPENKSLMLDYFLIR